MVFDRYVSYSIKGEARLARAGQHANRRHKLSLQTPLPPQKVVLTVPENKIQLIDIIIFAINRNDFKTFHEEADVIIIQQMLELATMLH